MRRRIGPTQRGSATTELAVVAPGLLMIVALLIMGGRITLAGGSVEHAAAEAARAASIARTATAAVADGTAAAQRSLDQQGLSCVGSPAITINAQEFARPPGEPAEVSATVTCVVQLSDITIPAVPGSRSITETVQSPLDTYRMRR